MLRQSRTMKSVIWGMVCLSAALPLSGCRHRRAAATLPPVLQAPDRQPPAPDAPPMESPPPDSITSSPQVKVTQTKPKKAPKKSTAKPTVPDLPPPVDEASTAPTAPASIGELSAGGDASSKTQQANDLIAACEQRANDPSQAKGQQATIRKVRYFIKEARQALGTGDAEGAMTLATKAKLLLDDLVIEAK
jgi:hypothetical protein